MGAAASEASGRRRTRGCRLLVAVAMVLTVLNLTTQPSEAVELCNTTAVTGVTTTGPANPYPSTITVSGISGAVSDINVRILDFTTFPDTDGNH